MTCTEEYKEHIEYTFHAFCKIVIRNASYTALRTWSRKHKREISLDYITDEKHYPLGTTDEYFKAPEPDEEYIVHLCGDTVSREIYNSSRNRADLQAQCCKINIENCLPQPSMDVSFEDILEFKNRRKDELNTFRAKIRELETNIYNAYSPELIRH